MKIIKRKSKISVLVSRNEKIRNSGRVSGTCWQWLSPFHTTTTTDNNNLFPAFIVRFWVCIISLFTLNSSDLQNRGWKLLKKITYMFKYISSVTENVLRSWPCLVLTCMSSCYWGGTVWLGCAWLQMRLGATVLPAVCICDSRITCQG